MAWQFHAGTKCPISLPVTDARGVMAAQFDGPRILHGADEVHKVSAECALQHLKIIWCDRYRPGVPIREAVASVPF